MIAQNQKDQIANFHIQPICKYMPNKNKIYFALEDQSIKSIDLQTLNVSHIHANHQKRINNIKIYQNLLVSCSNDSTIRLWDTLISKPIHTFKKQPDHYFSVALNKNILAGGGDGRIIFWDLRKMREKTIFQDSFNDQITGLQFDPNQANIIYGCSVDGFLNCFDINQNNEQDAGVWYHRLDNPPQQLKCENSFLNIHTTDHTILILKQECVYKKRQIASGQQPRNLFWSCFQQQKLRYYTWNVNNSIIQKWEEQQCVYQFSGLQNIDFLQQLGERKSLIADTNGCISIIKLQQYNERYEIERDEIYDEGIISKQGFIKQKFKKGGNCFKPF